MSRTEIPVNVDVQSSSDEIKAKLARLVDAVAANLAESDFDEIGHISNDDVRGIIAAYRIVVAEVGEVTALRQQVEELQDDIEELRGTTFPKSWGGFKAFIYEVYPGDVFPDDGRELGPQFVVAARRLTEATSERDALQARLDAVLDVCLELERGANQAEYRNGGEESFTVAATRECVSTVRAAARGQEG